MSEKLSRVSTRKAAANRQNALKSIGPKTPRGKAYSRRNALKHGLFAMDLFRGEGANRENSEQYQELLDRLAKDYQPVGAAEHLEVERIAACWWKVRRAWRYENSEIAYKHAAVDARLQELVSPKTLVSDSPLSPEEMDAANARFQEVWAVVEGIANKQLALVTQVSAENRLAATDPDSHTKFLLKSIQTGIYILEHKIEPLIEVAAKSSYDNMAVPKAEVLDRLLRAEAAAERNLGRAIDRLERLQRRCLGEALPPPVSVRLTR